MEKLCKNCKYFVRGSSIVFFNPEYIWGDCVNPEKIVVNLTDKEKRGVFKWATNICENFEPVQEHEKNGKE